MKKKLSGRDAFDFAYSNYTDTLYRVAVHNTREQSDAEDAVQEVFVKLLEKTRSFKDEEHLKAWLIRVTINICHTYYRQSGKTEELPENLPAPDMLDFSVLDYVKALPENYRNAIYLHYFEGYTAQEIADILSSNQNTVLSWLKRGRELLKERIGGFDDE